MWGYIILGVVIAVIIIAEVGNQDEIEFEDFKFVGKVILGVVGILLFLGFSIAIID